MSKFFQMTPEEAIDAYRATHTIPLREGEKRVNVDAGGLAEWIQWQIDRQAKAVASAALLAFEMRTVLEKAPPVHAEDCPSHPPGQDLRPCTCWVQKRANALTLPVPQAAKIVAAMEDVCRAAKMQTRHAHAIGDDAPCVGCDKQDEALAALDAARKEPDEQDS